ncbi:MAG TPA: RidA family protein [Dehalococcoidia bacterium]|nr:RidA family protein [Dehalococcoidia bacterium]
MLQRIDLYPDKTKYKNYSFSSCIIAGDFIFTSHQEGALSDDGEFLPTIEEQTE